MLLSMWLDLDASSRYLAPKNLVLKLTSRNPVETIDYVEQVAASDILDGDNTFHG